MYVQRANEADADAISSVLLTSFAEYEDAYTPEAFAVTTPSAEVVRERVSEGPMWVAVQEDRVVGTVAAVLREKGLYIRSMAVLPTARGQRVGEMLLGEVERFAREAGAEYMYLSTTPFLDRAIRLYEHFGFQRPDERYQDLHGTPLVTMVKPLLPSEQWHSD